MHSGQLPILIANLEWLTHKETNVKCLSSTWAEKSETQNEATLLQVLHLRNNSQWGNTKPLNVYIQVVWSRCQAYNNGLAKVPLLWVP